MRGQTLAILKALISVVIWGASFVATKISLHYVSPVTLVWLRFAMGVLILGFAVWFRRQFFLPARKDMLYFAFLGFLGITFHQWLQSTGLVTAQATTSAWIVASTPIFMALLGWLALRERLIWSQVIGIFLATFGVLLVVSRGNLFGLLFGKIGAIGDFLMLVSALNWAVFSTLSRHGLHKHSATLMMFYVMVFGWLFSSVLFLTGQGFGEINHIPLDGWLGIAFLGIFCSGLAYIFWYDALQVLPIAQTGAFLYIEPMITLIIAGFVLREKLLPTTLVGGMTILMGVWLVNRPKFKLAAP
jgi:drug/metabolite transporter (DMT)-like permease